MEPQNSKDAQLSNVETRRNKFILIKNTFRLALVYGRKLERSKMSKGKHFLGDMDSISLK